MEKKRIIKSPKPDIEHNSQLLVKGALGGIPIAGGLAGEIVDLIWRTGYESRVEEWRNIISIELSNKFDESNISELIDNEEFKSLFAESTIIAIKNHQEEKLIAIRNLLVNSTSSPIEYDFKKLFLNYIDQFTTYHLRTIGHIYENIKAKNSNFLTLNDHYEKIQSEVFHGEAELQVQVIEELMVVKGLITKRKGSYAGYNITSYYDITEIGKKFLNLIMGDDYA